MASSCSKLVGVKLAFSLISFFVCFSQFVGYIRRAILACDSKWGPAKTFFHKLFQSIFIYLPAENLIRYIFKNIKYSNYFNYYIHALRQGGGPGCARSQKGPPDGIIKGLK